MDLIEFQKKKGFIKIKLKKTKTNHFELKSSINSFKGRFILDTGASNTCIDIDNKDYFKINPKDSEIKAAGAGSSIIATQIANNIEIKIGNWKTSNFTLVLIDLSHVNYALDQHGVRKVDGIIGSDILEKGQAVIDYKNRLLYLKKTRNSK